MFSWTKDRKGSAYPGRRGSKSKEGSSSVHVPISGSIRPPEGGYSRAQHIQSYLDDESLKRSTRRVSSDDTTHDTVFQTTKGDTLILRVNVPLSSSFATFVPAMTLAGVKVNHPWIDSRMRVVGYAPIQSESSWKDSQLLLGKAVKAVVQHIQLNPPEILEITDKGLQSIQAKKGVRSSSIAVGSSTIRSVNGASPPSYQTIEQQPQNFPPAPELPLPVAPKTYPEVANLTRTELEKLMEDELEFLAFVHKIPTYEEIQSIAMKQVDDNAKLAEENLDQESKVKELHQEVVTLRSQLQEKVKAFQALEVKQKALCAPPDFKSTLRKLNAAKKEAFDQSEEYADEWVEDGAKDVDQFVKAFVAKRKLHHQRAGKLELLQSSA